MLISCHRKYRFVVCHGVTELNDGFEHYNRRLLKNGLTHRRIFFQLMPTLLWQRFQFVFVHCWRFVLIQARQNAVCSFKVIHSWQNVSSVISYDLTHKKRINVDIKTERPTSRLNSWSHSSTTAKSRRMKEKCCISFLSWFFLCYFLLYQDKRK